MSEAVVAAWLMAGKTVQTANKLEETMGNFDFMECFGLLVVGLDTTSVSNDPPTVMAYLLADGIPSKGGFFRSLNRNYL
jgi:hypothetical protein